jgi:NADP-dependent alcohol dehydrogenase
MMNFDYQNPVHIVFGKGQIANLAELIDAVARVMIVYGGGSIKKNNVYDQVTAALKNHSVVEFSGIEPNPEYETCMKAVEKVKAEKVDFILAVGGGSVLDAVKFIAAAARFEANDPWDILAKQSPVTEAIPLGSVLTLPATGSEMNRGAVISRSEIKQKLFFLSNAVYPRFSILDPETTFTLPARYTVNGIVDAFVHVAEQYLTFPANAPLQDRMCESVLQTLVEEGPKVLSQPEDYSARANVMWAATCALNGFIGLGVPQDWATHIIGHEITAEFGPDHAQTLAIVLPGVLHLQKEKKKAKLLQYAERVFGLTGGSDEERADAAIVKTEEFFRALGQRTKLSEYGIGEEAVEVIAERIAGKPFLLGEHQDIDSNKVKEILKLRV